MLASRQELSVAGFEGRLTLGTESLPRSGSRDVVGSDYHNAPDALTTTDS